MNKFYDYHSRYRVNYNTFKPAGITFYVADTINSAYNSIANQKRNKLFKNYKFPKQHKKFHWIMFKLFFQILSFKIHLLFNKNYKPKLGGVTNAKTNEN